MSGILSVMLGDNAAASTFSPASMTGLIGWWKADTGVTGNPVTAVVNQASPGTYDLVNSGTVPYNATGFQGLPAFDFVNINHAALVASPFAMGTGTTGSAFVIGKMKTDTPNFGGAVCYAGNASEDFNSSGSSGWITRQGTSNGIETFRNFTSVIDTAISLDTAYVLGSIYDGTSVTHWINATIGSTSSAGLPMNWISSSGTLVIGSRVGTSGGVATTGNWDGPIAEIIVTTADNTADVAHIYAYAQAKYGAF